ncbi:hypothetical protein KFL_001010045 [Klebsormidium nitens]|uniref:MYND-type domain-containing protein n=1 Tax=Klebsormidium nitens TaxID=105231 RepID=A0A1Y1I1W3_KLENI|nr:hypothetical protein KFL_001010045 [Klebsormidium nitens]|eukprot:GAQ82118.1 hypothetical protein KFL_001010045 [Klebsormidium nitens]
MGPKSKTKIPEVEIKIDKETYLSIVYEAARKLRLNIIRKPISAEEMDYIDYLPPGADSSIKEAAIMFNLESAYEKDKHFSPDIVRRHTLGALSVYQIQAQFQAVIDGDLTSLDNLYPTVKPKRVCDNYLLTDKRKTPDPGVIYRPWSSESPDPYIALVYGYETGPGVFKDAWVYDPCFLQAFQSPADAFERAIQNLGRITVGQFKICVEPSLKAVTSHWGEYKGTNCRAVRFGQPPSAVFVTFFGDHRDCPRFLIPEVVKLFAEGLNCDLESVVVVLWSGQQVHVASARDQKAMYTPGRMQHLMKFQTEAAAYNDRICATPFQVKGLSSDESLVEWKPYPLYGKMEALRVPRGGEPGSTRVLYPVPRTEAEARKLERLGDKIPVVTELSLPQCAKCGKKDEDLLRCAKCKKERYCSRDCQIKHWAAGHKKVCAP